MLWLCTAENLESSHTRRRYDKFTAGEKNKKSKNDSGMHGTWTVSGGGASTRITCRLVKIISWTIKRKIIKRTAAWWWVGGTVDFLIYIPCTREHQNLLPHDQGDSNNNNNNINDDDAVNDVLLHNASS